MKRKSPRIALIVSGTLNLLMGVVEIFSGIISGSSALIADSLDFMVDGVNYFSSLVILKKTEKTHETAGKIKAYIMLLFGAGILVISCIKLAQGWIPRGEVMSVIWFCALVVNLLSAWLLQKFQNNSLDLRAVWLCTRNDAVWNILIIIAGYLTLYFTSPLPDIIVSVFMGILVIKSALTIIRGWHDGHDHH